MNSIPWMEGLRSQPDDDARISWIRDDEHACMFKDAPLPDPLDRLNSLFDDKRKLREAYYYIGVRYYQKMRMEEVLECFQTVLEMNDGSDYFTGMAKFYLGVIFRNEDRFEEAYRMFLEVIPVLEEQEMILSLAGAYQNLGSIDTERNHLEDATKNLERSIELFQEVGDETGLAMSLSDYGAVCWIRGEAAQALKYHLQAFKKLGDSDNRFLLANIHNRIGLCYYRFSEFEKALTEHMKALRIQEEHGMRSSCAFSLNHIGAIHRNLKNYDLALEYYRKSLQIYLDINHHLGIGMIYNNIGLIYQDQRNFEEALSYFLKAKEIKTRFDLQQTLPITLENIGICYTELGDYDQAFACQTQALAMYEETPGNIGNIGCLVSICELFAYKYRDSGEMESFHKSMRYYDMVDEAIGKRNEKDIRSTRLQLQEIGLKLLKAHAEKLFSKGEFEQSSIYYRKANALFDSMIILRDEIYDDRRRIRITDLQMLYDMEKKEAEAQIARQEAEIMRLKNVELEEMNQRLIRTQNEMLELERNNSILAMAVTANHEINQPLMVIRGNLDMLTQNLGGDKKTPETMRYLSRIDESLMKIKNILCKFKESNRISIEAYSQGTQMVVFDRDEEGN